MPAPTPLKTLLSEQQQMVESLGQHTMQSREFLTYISPLLTEGSPARSRGTSANGTRRTASPQQQATPTKAVNPSVNTSTVSSNSSPTKQAAVSGVAAAPNAYMNELPLAPYGSTAHLTLHVTETLELALRILKKNKQIGRQLTKRDQQVLAEIGAFYEAPQEQQQQADVLAIANTDPTDANDGTAEMIVAPL